VIDFEALVRRWNQTLNGQYPRPWMSDLQDPTLASVFIVGPNQATPFPVELVGSQDKFLDALFNPRGRSHAALYESVRAGAGKGASPTRRNIVAMSATLRRHGVSGILETNVICYSTPKSADLANAFAPGRGSRGQARLCRASGSNPPEGGHSPRCWHGRRPVGVAACATASRAERTRRLRIETPGDRPGGFSVRAVGDHYSMPGPAGVG
jgi:hypothetical protein